MLPKCGVELEKLTLGKTLQIRFVRLHKKPQKNNKFTFLDGSDSEHSAKPSGLQDKRAPATVPKLWNRKKSPDESKPPVLPTIHSEFGRA